MSGNSGIHALRIAEELNANGHSCGVSTPEIEQNPINSSAYIPIMFAYGKQPPENMFQNKSGCDLVIAMTPRQHVRNQTLTLCEFYDCPYIVHLEDNEVTVLIAGFVGSRLVNFSHLPSTHLNRVIPEWRIWPGDCEKFLQNAIGVSALNNKLKEFTYPNQPFIKFNPGYDESFANSFLNIDRVSICQKYHIPLNDHLIVYTGAIHEVNIIEIESLFFSVYELRRRGINATLIKTGVDGIGLIRKLPPEVMDFIIDLGFVERTDLPSIIKLATVLVQPGTADKFNDYRFPSKLPEYLATGIPVILPKSNIGEELQDGVNCLLLEQGHYIEIADKVQFLLSDKTRADLIGNAGKKFALQHLSWKRNIKLLENWLQLVARNRAHGSVEAKSPSADSKLIAFFLPQFHEISENNLWWGQGFTEWTNVRRAEASFLGHDQPRVPLNSNYYELNSSSVLKSQTEVAKKFGLYGFCFYYYWFNGKRLLEKPVNAYLNDPSIDFPFCICWANENWTRRWDGLDEEVLISQDYQAGWVDRIFQDFEKLFSDPRYIRKYGMPLLLVYRVDKIPNSLAVFDRWRQLAGRAGYLGLHIVGVQYIGMTPQHPLDYGADATVEFPPHMHRSDRTFIDPNSLKGLVDGFEGYVEDYIGAAKSYASRPAANSTWYRGIIPAWDNTARRGKKGHIYINSSPEIYEHWLRFLVDCSRVSSQDREYIFINAWNEWAEGAYLEPDDRHKYGYLKATSKALRNWSPF
jgi:glycosyltransferase involved in cell wall biosynthesis